MTQSSERRENYEFAYPIEHNPLEARSNRAILLPGQDIRKVGMFDEVMQHPAGREALHRGNEILKNEYGFDLIDMATSTGDRDGDTIKHARLRQTRYTQPAVYLASMAIHNVNKSRGHKGYKTIPEYYSGVSMGMGTAATLAGFMDFETGLRFHAERGRIMQEFSDPQPTSMAAILANEQAVLEVLGEKNNSRLDLCLINDDKVWVVGGPNEDMARLKGELQVRKIKAIDVDTDRAMHGRYVRKARPVFDEMIDTIEFKQPVSSVIGSVKGLPIRNEEDMKDELKIGFDHTVDNRKPLHFFNAARIHTFSEVGNPKGNFGRTMEKVFNAHNLQKAAEVAGVTAAVGIGVYEVITQWHRHHPENPQNGNH